VSQAQFVGITAAIKPMKTGRRANHCSVKTENENWQLQCWKLVAAKQSFEVEGAIGEHREFFKALSVACNYRMKRLGTRISFAPKESK
jgi:hypothetical protein